MKLLAGTIPTIALFGAMPLASKADSTEAGAATYSRDVAKILNTNCVSCHRPGEIAPMALRDYAEVRPWVKAIRKAVSEKTMPPWHADPAYGHFSNDRRLSDEERSTIEKWIDAGAPEGNPADLPPAPKFVDGWRLGEPDHILTLPEVKLLAGGPDVFQEVAVDSNLTEDKWITAIEVQPGNRKVTHHVIAFAIEPGGGGPNGWLGGWAAGLEPMVFKEGTGRVLKKGSKVVGDMHYHPTDVPATDQTKIGLHFAKVEPKKEVVNLWILNAAFKIPAGAENHEVRSSYTFEQDSQILALLPHMHYRGKDFTYTAKFPDGREEILLKVPKYDFNWQTDYTLEKPIAAPKGTRINCVAHFDNSTNNPANPDASRDVTFGNQSFDEMMIGFVDFVVDDGVRPDSPQLKMANRMRELISQHPGDVYDVKITEDDGSEMTGLYFPPDGDGLWLIRNNGQLMEAKVRETKWFGPLFTARIMLPGLGIFKFNGSFERTEGNMRGVINLGPQGSIKFEGTRAKENRGL